MLSFLLNSMTKEVLGQVTTESSTAGAWRTIVGMFSSQSRAWIVHLCSKLSRTHKGDSTAPSSPALARVIPPVRPTTAR
jgi:hypothetical protein